VLQARRSGVRLDDHAEAELRGEAQAILDRLGVVRLAEIPLTVAGRV